MAKLTIYIGITVGSILGAYLPVLLFHVGALSWVSILLGFVGGFVGAWVGWKLTEWIES